LITEWVSEVKAIKISEIILLWNEVVWDIVSSFILDGPRLCLGKCLIKIFTAGFAEVLGFMIFF